MMNTPIEINASIVSRPIDITALTYADNPQPRCPVVLLLDTSHSMAGSPIAELEEGVSQFYGEIANDAIASMSVEISLITFGESVNHLRQFETAKETLHTRLPGLQAMGMTPMGAAIDLSLREISKRRAFYKKNGLSAYKPWLVLMTDGKPNDEWQQPSAIARAMASRGDLIFLGVGIGDSVDMHTLNSIVPESPGAHRLRGLAFKQFFHWLSDSLKVVSTSSTTQQGSIPNPNSYGWKL